jgi:uncharacterized membrane protein
MKVRTSPIVLAIGLVVLIVAATLAVAQGPARQPTVLGSGPLLIDPAPAAFGDCPADYVCLWENTNYSGTMVGFTTCCMWFDLADYFFNNKTSSWRNRKSEDATLAKGTGGSGDRLCLDNNSSASSMPSGWNDVASSIRIRDDGNHC